MLAQVPAVQPLSNTPGQPVTGLSAAHERRLRDVWRSAGWPCHDNLELDLLAAGLLALQRDEQGRETLRPTDAGLVLLAAKRLRHQQALSAHETLVRRVALHQQREGRVVWCGLSLRAPLAVAAEAASPGPAVAPAPNPVADASALSAGAPAAAAQAVRWAVAMPDVYAIRYTTVESLVEPAAFEIKVSRADLLGDLRRPAKAAAYLALAGQCWYVLKRGIADVDEIPPAFGVMWADDESGFETARRAPVRPFKLPFPVWMALARATALPPLEDDSQQLI